MAIKQSKPPTTSSDPRTRRETVSIFALKAVATTLAGGALTLGISIAQTSYSNHLEVLRRQADQGAEFQVHLLDLSGRFENELWEIALMMGRGGSREEAERLHDEAASRVAGNLESLYRQWHNQRLLLRNRGSQIYGRQVGALIYDRPDALFHADGCDVVRRDFGPEAADCAEPMRRELNWLRPFVGGIAQSNTLDAFRTSARSPTSFNANAEIAYTIIHHYFDCTGSSDPNVPRKPRCNNLPDMIAIARRRASLARAARENLANAILAASVLSE